MDNRKNTHESETSGADTVSRVASLLEETMDTTDRELKRRERHEMMWGEKKRNGKHHLNLKTGLGGS